MNLRLPLRFFNALALTGIMISCGSSDEPSVEPASSPERLYGHELLSREECLKRQLISRDEFICSESILFQPDGKVSFSLGGNDVGSYGTYQRRGKKIMIDQQSVKSLSFEVLSDTTLKRIETGAIWRKY